MQLTKRSWAFRNRNLQRGQGIKPSLLRFEVTRVSPPSLLINLHVTEACLQPLWASPCASTRGLLQTMHSLSLKGV